MTMDIDEELKAFEEWALKAGCFPIERLKRAPRYFQDSHTESAFLGWLGRKESQAEQKGLPANAEVTGRASAACEGPR